MTPKKRKVASPAPKRAKTEEKDPRHYPDADPEWQALEERYSTIGSEMRSLAKMLNISGGGGDEQP